VLWLLRWVIKTIKSLHSETSRIWAQSKKTATSDTELICFFSLLIFHRQHYQLSAITATAITTTTPTTITMAETTTTKTTTVGQKEHGEIHIKNIPNENLYKKSLNE
jgi:hypothetical protein